MDPVSAVGLAAAVAQFLEISIKATLICIRIRDAEKSAQELYKELRDHLRELKAARIELIQRPPGSIPRRIQDLAINCNRLADDLLKVLSHISGTEQNVSIATKVLRTLRERRTIEKLQNDLKVQEKALESLLVQDIWRRFDLQTIQQTHRFSSLDAKSQDIIARIEKLDISSRDRHAQVTTDVKSLDTRIDQQFSQADTAARKRHEEADRTSEHRHRETQATLDKHHQQANQDRAKKAVLKSLFFPEIDERRSSIHDATPGTLKWIFPSQADSDSDDEDGSTEADGYNDSIYSGTDNGDSASEDEDHSSEFDSDSDSDRDSDTENPPTWHNLEDWLRSQNSVYWIHGKLGSGKSTLMAHLVEHHRTREALREWSKGKHYHVLSFFFWRPGTQLQNSILGLLRSLLHQLCLIHPGLALSLCSSTEIEIGTISVWTEKSLSKAVTSALRASNDCFCIFIDGLDEFTGDYDHLLDTIFALQVIERVKFCVSSRPEIQLTHRLADCKQLRLQDLNHHDIKTFVRKRLGDASVRLDSLPENRSLDSLIISRAEGVFLWAALVTQAVIRGFRAADDDDTLVQRVHNAPRGVEELFATMLGNMDELYKESFAFYVKFLQVCENSCASRMASLVILTGALHEEAAMTDESFIRLCEKTEVQVVARSAGLLEFCQNEWGYSLSRAQWYSATEWSIRHDNTVRGRLDQAGYMSGERKILEEPPPYPTLFSQEKKTLDWVHRSAYDFIKDTAHQKKFQLPCISTEYCTRLILQASLRYLSTAPSYEGEIQTLSEVRLWFMLKCLSFAWNLDRQLSIKITDQLRALYDRMDKKERFKPLESCMPQYFWVECAKAGHLGYLQLHIESIPWWFLPETLQYVEREETSTTDLTMIILSRILSFTPFPNTKPASFVWPGQHLSFRFNPVYRLRGYSYSSDNAQSWGAESAFSLERLSVSRCVAEFYEVFRAFLRKGESDARIASLFYKRHQIAAGWNLYIQIASVSKIRLHLSTRLLWNSRNKYQHNSAGPTYPPRGLYPENTGSLRLICTKEEEPWGPCMDMQEIGDFAVIELSAATSSALLSIMTIVQSRKPGVRAYILAPGGTLEFSQLEGLFEMVMSEVRTNEPGRSASDQLLALSCIESHLHKLLESITIDSEFPSAASILPGSILDEVEEA